MCRTRRFTKLGRLAVAIAVQFCLAASSQAQSSSAGAMGAFGNRSMGSAYTAPQSSFRGSSSALGALGAGGGFGGGSIAGATTRGDATVGQVTGAERFVRGNRQGNFVGSDANDAGSFLSQLSSLSNVANQGRRGQGGQQSNPNQAANSFGGGGASGFGAQSQYKARVERTVGFTYRSPSPSGLGSTLEQRLQKSARIEKRGPITVQVTGSTAILTGVVATEHARDLAAQLVLLEPGVAAVQNDLKIAAPSPAESPPTPQLPSLPTP